MQRYSVDFFDRNLTNIYHDTVGSLDLRDDYISFQRNTITIRYTSKPLLNSFIRIHRADFSFFGVVSDIKPASDNTLDVTFKNFISVFDEDTLFDTDLQKRQSTVAGIDGKTNSKSLEQMLKDQIDEQYVTCADAEQRLKIKITAVTSTRPWGFNLVTDTEGMHHCIIGLYGVLIVNAMKKYGVALEVEPDFVAKVVNIKIINRSIDTAFNIDGNLPNVYVQTLKVNDRPTGVNKLIVYNTNDYSHRLAFYVYKDRTWGINEKPAGKERITPVSLDLKGAMPDSSIEDPDEAFVLAAVDVAHSVLSGLEWDNLIEIDVSETDRLIEPLELKFGQKVTLGYKGDSYTSILTGRDISTRGLTLIFGSERIKLTKRARL
jgi:hypothetical protein